MSVKQIKTVAVDVTIWTVIAVAIAACYVLDEIEKRTA